MSTWAILVDTLLALDLASRALHRVGFWAANSRDTGLAAFQDVVQRCCYIMCGDAYDRLPDTATAYALIREVAKNCKPVKKNGIDALRSILRTWRDLTVCFCARVVGAGDEASFLQELDVAFGGHLLSCRDLTSSMLQSYSKVFGTYAGAFNSKTAQLNQKRGWVRPRKSRSAAGALENESAAASSSGNVDVATQTDTGGVETSMQDGICDLDVGPALTTWYAPLSTSSQGHMLQCVEYGHTFTLETFMHYCALDAYLHYQNWRCPWCNYPLRVLPLGNCVRSDPHGIRQ